MASRRDVIRMTDDEAYAFLDSMKIAVVGTVGSDGFPHLVSVGYLVEDGCIAFSSFAAAQKVKNLERTGQATALVEVSWPYNDVKGVMVSGPVRIVRDTPVVADLAARTKAKHAQMSGTTEGTPEDMDVLKYAAKRVAIYIEPARIRSWDHSKLGGTY